MRSDRYLPMSLAVPGALLLLLTATAHAAEPARGVKLTALDGATTVEGQLADFTDGLYTLDTEIGRLTVPADRVTCAGPGCPGNPATPAPPSAPEPVAAAQSMIAGLGGAGAGMAVALAPGAALLSPAVAAPTPADTRAALPCGDAAELAPVGAAGGPAARLRFTPGGGQLDAASLDALDGLLQRIRAERPAEVVLLGHAEDGAAARALSVALAGNAEKALRARDTDGALSRVVLRAAGAGARAPVDCGDDLSAEWLNRRVEVWIRG